MTFRLPAAVWAFVTLTAVGTACAPFGIFASAATPEELEAAPNNPPTAHVDTAGADPHVVVYGDTRTGDEVHRKIIARIQAQKPQAVFHTGDLVGNGHSQSDWRTFNSITQEIRRTIPMFPVLGNHEGGSRYFFDNFELPNNERWYTVHVGSLRFIMLDSNTSLSMGSAQQRWLADTLANREPQVEQDIAIFHHPLYSTGNHGADTKGIAKILTPMFKQAGVKLVFSGHDHNYERSEALGITFITAGGGGAPLYSQERTSPHSRLYLKEHHYCVLDRQNGSTRVRVLGIDDKKLDEFSVP